MENEISMSFLKNAKNIFWDFDGVIMDSMPIRNRGFELVLKDYPDYEVEKLMQFHSQNGGLSRYVKFRYFFEEVRSQNITDEEVKVWAARFSEIMLTELTNPSLLIHDSINFIKKNSENYNMHIVSGSDQDELRKICAHVGITEYFISIHGSPTPKKQLVQNLMKKHGYYNDQTILIGDSINDYEAATYNSLSFAGYNNPGLKSLKAGYIKSFDS
jgi:HAD superfamily hydrolase (TIGR01549 family)